MLCRHGKHAVGLRINTLITCTEQQTVQVLTHVLIHTPDKSQRYYPIQIHLWNILPQSIDKLVIYSIMITAGKHGIQSMQG